LYLSASILSIFEMFFKAFSSFIDSVQDVLIASGYFFISSRTAITKQGQGVGQSPFF
jgi:hypothetical protein